MDKPVTIYNEYYRITEELFKTHGPYTILLYQVGAFYEVYAEPNSSSGQLEKSQIVEFARICQLNISNDKTEQPTKKTTHVMAGFRDYCLDKYLEILMANGMTAVVYNQKKEGKKITREFYKTFSPGTYISYDTEQSPRMNNQIMCIWLDTYKTQQRTNTQIVYGLANTDIYTGESNIFEHETQYIVNPTTFDELERRVSTVQPSEIILISTLTKEETQSVIQYAGIKTSHIHVILIQDPNDPNVEIAKKCAKQVYIHELITSTYGDESYQICQEFQQYTYATQAFCYLLHFMQQRNPDLLKKIAFPSFINSSNRMILANHTLSQLNIIDTEQGKGVYSSVTTFLNKCSTPMGRRAFKRQITQPTFDETWLNQEYEMIQVLLDNEPNVLIPNLRKHISQIRDLEKISRQIVHDKMYPSSIATLYTSIQKIRHIAILIQDLPTTFHQYLTTTNIEDVSIGLLDFIDKTILVEKCRNTNGVIDENIFCKGVSKILDNFVKELDENQAKLGQIHTTLSNLLRTSQDTSPDNASFVKIHETEKSGISLLITKTRAQKLRSILASNPRLQITANFHIDVKDIKFTNSKQASSEEINIPILSEIVKNIAHLKESLKIETQKCFKTFIQSLAEEYTKIDDLIKYISKVDVIQTKAHVAKEFNYCRPQIQSNQSKSSVNVKAIRHVLIEHIQQNEIYVTNDLDLDDKSRGILLYGTNAVGKTSFIRAIGIAIIMAQSGMYVPAEEFVYSPYKAIFSRILGNDNLFKGLSTFAVEMSELRVILKEADEYSLILGDELCSGTETESALSIFTAGLRYLYDKNATFLFATHFHEILRYDEIKALEKMRVMHMAVHYDREKDALVYTRKLQDGPGNRMYGLEVCQSLYLPQEFLDEAYRIRNTYFPDTSQNLSSPQTKYNAKKVRGKCEMCNDAMGEEIHHLSPQKDAQSNGFIGHFHKNHAGNLISICQKCHDTYHTTQNAPILSKKKTTKGYKIV